MYAREEPLDVDRLMREIRAEIAARLPDPAEEGQVESVGDSVGFQVGGVPTRLGRFGDLSEPLARKASIITRVRFIFIY